MKKVVRSVARVLLWVITGMIPFVIAACYGAMYEFSRNGRVVDASTRQGVRGIKVSCQHGTSAGVYTSSTDYTSTDGSFWIEDEARCFSVLFEDVDGPANGSYQSRTVPGTEVYDGIEIELTPEP